jgi:hypothetical protein
LAPTVVSFDDDRSTQGWTAAWSNAESVRHTRAPGREPAALQSTADWRSGRRSKVAGSRNALKRSSFEERDLVRCLISFDANDREYREFVVRTRGRLGRSPAT